MSYLQLTHTDDDAPPERIEEFDYALLDAETADKARDAAARIRAKVHDIGNELLAMKKMLGHGHFTAWVKAELRFTMRTAERRMAEAELLAKNDKLAALPLPVFRAIAKAPDVIRGELEWRADQGHFSAASDVQKAIDRQCGELEPRRRKPGRMYTAEDVIYVFGNLPNDQKDVVLGVLAARDGADGYDSLNQVWLRSDEAARSAFLDYIGVVYPDQR